MRPTIVYLHGFRSSPASVKARALVAAVEALPAHVQPVLHVPFLRFAPREAIAAVTAWVRDNVAHPTATLTFVGSSLGGFYATHLAQALGARAVLINPAMRPYDDLASYVGAQTNLHSGETFVVAPAHFVELRELAVERLAHPERFFLMVQTGDEVLDWREAVTFFGGAWQFVQGGGDHGFRQFELQIPAVLRFAGVEART